MAESCDRTASLLAKFSWRLGDGNQLAVGFDLREWVIADYGIFTRPIWRNTGSAVVGSTLGTVRRNLHRSNSYRRGGIYPG